MDKLFNEMQLMSQGRCVKGGCHELEKNSEKCPGKGRSRKAT